MFKNMMPSMRESFLKRKRSADFELNSLSKSHSTIVIPSSLGLGSAQSSAEMPLYTKTGLMMTQVDSKKSQEKK